MKKIKLVLLFACSMFASMVYAKPIVQMLYFEADNGMFDKAHKEADRLLKVFASNKAAFEVKE